MNTKNRAVKYAILQHMPPTLKQRKTFAELVENGGKKHTSLGAAMLAAGYSESTSKTPQKLTESRGWAELLAEVSDEPLLSKIKQIALSEDKRAALQAIDMLMKLKDRYPAGKLKVQQYDEEVARLKSGPIISPPEETISSEEPN